MHFYYQLLPYATESHIHRGIYQISAHAEPAAHGLHSYRRKASPSHEVICIYYLLKNFIFYVLFQIFCEIRYGGWAQVDVVAHIHRRSCKAWHDFYPQFSLYIIKEEIITEIWPVIEFLDKCYSFFY